MHTPYASEATRYRVIALNGIDVALGIEGCAVRVTQHAISAARGCAINERAADVLMAAMIEGVPQLRGQGCDYSGGFCTMGLLLYSSGCRHLHAYLANNRYFEDPNNKKAHEVCYERVYETYDMTYEEWIEVKKDNDQLGLDFLTIAWKHCPTYGSHEERV